QQACVLDLYDPGRANAVTHDGVPATWEGFVQAIAAPPPPGRRTHVLLEPTSSPHVEDLVRRVRARGDVSVHFDAPLARRAVWDGAKLAFGRVVEPRWDFSQAEVVLALDADFLGSASVPFPWMRDWATRRRPRRSADAMSRLYVAEARLSVTGMAADVRLRVQARQVATVAADVLAQVLSLLPQAATEVARDAASARAARSHSAWTRAVARDLVLHRGTSLVLAGDTQAPEVHAVAHALNEALGNAGRTVTYGPSSIVEAGTDSHGLSGLARALDAGEVGTLVVVGGDPAYTAAADVDFARRLRRTSTTAFVGARPNRTSSLFSWVAPEAHFLEAWGDARALDGTVSIAQPLIAPLVDGRTAAQILEALVGRRDASSRDLVMDYWRAHTVTADFDAFWQRALVNGAVEGSAEPPVEVRVDWTAVANALSAPPAPVAPLEIVYFADNKVHDGRFANHPWLQELADPITKLTWDNAALVSPATSARRGLATGDVVDLRVRGRSVRAPVLVCPSMADDVVAIALGYGQSVEDTVSFGAGANAYALRDSLAPWADDAAMERAKGSWPLALTQEHWTMAGRPLVLRRTAAEFAAAPDFARAMNAPPRSLYGIRPPAPHQWGMTVDLNACTGCSACVVACMAENNIPVVGKGGVRLSREMHWIRIDRYFLGEPNDAEVVVQPMLCQHCEAAPCEYVCPVNATVHSADGLNEMVYNRCVGTRFCSNNCPYKVRRFNYFNYTRDKPETLTLAMNPDVTVRARGVMEKCTYCVQRIREAEIRSRREERPLVDGEVLTACQQTCPTGAIVFGDIADPRSRVSEERRNPRLYAVLHDLGTIPRTRYLARIVNPNPAAGAP
ncbi:MAG TPA: 4Fe-4S dicluster domain-containing protein, partial [Polyangiaceae bacterium]|nr:4Fe-4S dicluster domain-containing protein [Polyangiaceae bacterium]